MAAIFGFLAAQTITCPALYDVPQCAIFFTFISDIDLTCSIAALIVWPVIVPNAINL